jgi:MFS family permease
MPAMSRPRAPLTPLSPAEVARGTHLSVIEGLFLALMMGFGGEGYFVLDLIRLGGSRHEQGLVVTLPLCLGALGPLLVLRLLHAARRRKPLVLAAALGQAAMLFLLAGADYLARASPAFLITIACLHQVCGQAVNTAWSSWFGDLVPGATRGRTFARRNRAVYVVTCLGLAAGGGLLQRLEPASGGAGPGGQGFALIYAIAGAGRLVSVALLALSPEPEFRGLVAPARVVPYLRTHRGASIARMLVSSATLYFSVYVASPYFLPYMKGELHFSYAETQAAQIAIVLLKVLFVPLWGGAIDDFGARAAFGLAALLLALIPIPWLWAGGLGWVLFAQGFSGTAWAGYEVALFALALERAPRRLRPQVFAVQSLLNGAAQLLGSQAGALVASLAGGEMRFVFAASLVARLVTALIMRRSVAVLPVERRVRKRELIATVIGPRPSGIAHRPLDPPSSGSPG